MKVVVGLFLILFPTLLFGQDQILGVYWTPDRDGKVEFIKRGNKYFGKLVYSARPGKDRNNPDPSMRNTDLVGADFIKNLVFDGDDMWENGTIYDSRTGKTYNCDITLLDNGDLKVRGYVGISLLGQSVVFYKIK